MREILIALGIVTALAGTAAARQQAAAPPQPPAPQRAPASTTAAPPAAAAQSDDYTYEPQGRRDPFVTVMGAGLEPKLMPKKGIGPAGMLTAEITVRGVMQSAKGYLALVQGSDMKTYVMHAGDKLLDGTVKTVSADGLTVVQDVNDPLSLAKTREVRKPLRSREDARK